MIVLCLWIVKKKKNKNCIKNYICWICLLVSFVSIKRKYQLVFSIISHKLKAKISIESYSSINQKILVFDKNHLFFH